MRTIERNIVAAHIYSADGMLLMARNTNINAGVVYGAAWKIPGGGVEPHETLTQALTREVVEEVGIDIGGYSYELLDDSMTGEAQKTLRDTGEQVIAKMQFFTYKIILKELAKDVRVILDTDEFTEYAWVNLPELKNYTLSPPSITLFTKLGLL